MIRERIVATRYGDAFIKYAQDKDGIGIEKAVLDIKAVREIMRANNDFKESLDGPEIPFVEKCEIIDAVLTDGFSDEIKHFLKLLIRDKRITHFLDIAEYIRTKYTYQGEQEAVLKTTFPLDLEMIKEIQDKVEAKFQKKFKFFIELDSRLLGGIQLIIGNKVIDGSVRRQLQNLKENLMAVRVN
jgi:F-type H+-transporting ATPase subunit delta